MLDRHPPFFDARRLARPNVDTRPVALQVTRPIAFLAAFLVAAAALAGCAGKQGIPPEMWTWDDEFPAHRVVGNIYFVGRKNLGIFLITTPQGHLLIDSGFEASVPALRASVEQLGFRFQDIKYLLASHAHVDHVQGHARVRALTGATVLASAADAPFIRSGGKDDVYYENRYRWTPCAVDRIVGDGEEVSIGGTTLVARLTPGHTPGAITWTTTVREAGQDLDVVFFPSANVPPGIQLRGNPRYAGLIEGFRKSFALWKTLPCDVFLGAHSVFYGLAAKHRRLADEGPQVFVDPEEFPRVVADREAAFLAQLGSP